MSKCGTNLLEIIDFCRFASSSIRHECNEFEKASGQKRRRLRAVGAHKGTLALGDHTCHVVYLYFSVLVMRLYNVNC